MSRPPAKELTERELEVMQGFWRLGETGIAEVRDDLAARGRELAYTTVATLVRILHDKGFLEQTGDRRPFQYRPARSYEDVSGALLKDIVQRVFGNSANNSCCDCLTRRGSPPRNAPFSRTS